MAKSLGPDALRFDFDAAAIEQDGREVAPERVGAAAGELRALVATIDSTAAGGDFAATPVPDAAEALELGTELPSSDAALSVAQFYDKVRAAISRAFPGEIWVTGEIRSLKESKGHRYLELADHDAAGVPRPAQQLEVACWSREWQRISTELSRAGTALEVGRVVRVRGKVSTWEGAGKLRLAMTALDVEALIGGIAVARQRLLDQLAEEGLLEANRSLALGPVPLRVGVVTSEGSEAHRDFAGCLDRSAFAFELHVERSLVQGTAAPWQLAGALKRLSRAGLDLLVVVRGGGGRGDLAAFDSEQVARAIAASPVPVWVGVGHTGDRSVADEVAHASFVTPTACGEAVVGRVGSYWAGIERSAARLAQRGAGELRGAEDRLGRSRSVLSSQVRHQLTRRAGELGVLGDRLAGSATRLVETEAAGRAAGADQLARCARAAASEEAHAVRRWRAVLGAYDPRRQLERGWSLTRDQSGRVLRSLVGVHAGAVVTTELADGELRSRIEELLASDRARPSAQSQPPAGTASDSRAAPAGLGTGAERER